MCRRMRGTSTPSAHPVMPFAVLLEVALQPCGWLAAYLGSALTSPVDLSFRNLGGTAELLCRGQSRRRDADDAHQDHGSFLLRAA